MIRGFEEEAFQSWLSSRFEQYNYAQAWGDSHFERLRSTDMISSAEVLDGDNWRKLTAEEQEQAYKDMYNIK